ncbi:MAG: sulfatase-like hydrolase/transferase [Actinomycetota bacterium]
MQRKADLPNVIVVVLDTARADAFEPYGAPGGSSPTVAQLASTGSAHPRVIAPCNWTLPSHVSMLTGLLPRTAGLSAFPGGDQKYCRPVLETHRDRWLPEVFRRAGYTTAGASTNVWISKRLGFDIGFGEFHDLVGRRVKQMHDPSLSARLRWYAQAFLARIDDGLSSVDRQIESWMAESHRPFFWFINIIECHSPYMPPHPYNDLGPLGRLLGAEDARRYQTLTGVWKCCATGVTPPRRALDRMRRLYDGSIRMMDDWLARLCERLDGRGVLDETLLVVTSDHGENFGEGNLIGHAVSLDDRLLSVPLVFHGPGAPVPDGSVTSLASLPRLVAEAVGLGEHPWSADELPRGAAVGQYDIGADPDDDRFGIIRDWGATAEGIRRFQQPGTAATDGRYKLVTLGDDERLYDLQTDPFEVTPRPPADGPPDVVKTLRAALAQARSTEWTPDVTALGSPDAAPPQGEVKELEDRMRLLGYL